MNSLDTSRFAWVLQVGNGHQHVVDCRRKSRVLANGVALRSIRRRVVPPKGHVWLMSRRTCRTSLAPLRSVASPHVSCSARAPRRGPLHQLLPRVSRHLSQAWAGRTDAHRARTLCDPHWGMEFLRIGKESLLQVASVESSRTRAWRVL